MPNENTKRGRLERAVLDAKNLVTGARVELELAVEGLTRAQPSEEPQTVLAVLELQEAIGRLVTAEKALAVAEERVAALARGSMS